MIFFRILLLFVALAKVGPAEEGRWDRLTSRVHLLWLKDWGSCWDTAGRLCWWFVREVAFRKGQWNSMLCGFAIDKMICWGKQSVGNCGLWIFVNQGISKHSSDWRSWIALKCIITSDYKPNDRNYYFQIISLLYAKLKNAVLIFKIPFVMMIKFYLINKFNSYRTKVKSSNSWISNIRTIELSR